MVDAMTGAPPADDKTANQQKYEHQMKASDMPQETQDEAIQVAIEALKLNNIEKDIAQHIKKEFDRRKGPSWHCIVGRSWGSFVTHESKTFAYFYLNHLAILLFKTQ